MELIKDSIINQLTPEDKQALAYYWQVSYEQDELINEHVLRVVMKYPDVVAYISSLPPADLAKQRENGKINLRQALNEGIWGPLIESWNSIGTRLAIEAISLQSWYKVFAASREVLIPLLYDAYGRQSAKYQEAIRGMDLYFDIGHLVISMSYINAKEDLIRKEEEKRRTSELELNQRLTAIIEAADEAIISEDGDAIVTLWNSGAERLYGYTTAEMIGKSMALLEPPETAGETSFTIERIKLGERTNFETLRIRKDGTRVSISESVSPILNRNGEIIGVMTIAHDITEQKRRVESQLELERFSASRRLWGDLAAELNDRLETIKNVHAMLLRKISPNSSDRKLLDIAIAETEKLIRYSRGIS